MFAERKVIPLHARVRAAEAPADLGPNTPDMNVRVLGGLAQWVREHRGADVLAEIAIAADVPVENLDGKSHWTSHARFEALLAGCRALMGSDDEFEEACVHQLQEAYGPLRFALRAVSPRLMFVQAAKFLPMVSRISSVEIVDETHNYMRVRYRTERSESTLMSLSRDAQTKAIPTLWGLPKAELRVLYRDHAGNCEYEVRWQVKPTWLPAAAGALGAAGFTLALSGLAGIGGPLALLALPLFGGAVGHVIALRRAAALNASYSASQTAALEELAAEAFQAKQEAMELSQRQQDWSRMMEERVDDRNRELRMLRERLSRLGVHEVDQDRLRGVSHDLRSPLHLITTNLEVLRRSNGPEEEARQLALHELERYAENMTSYVEELLSSFSDDSRFVTREPKDVDTEGLEMALRRRLRAFVKNGRVRTTVISTREAPQSVRVVREVLDRVLDNLLTNAAKYTDRGSILVELGGTPGYLTIKVSDTGRGIEEEKLRAVFVPGGSDEKTRAPSSYGLGLSIVVRLMNEVGGRLEVMSRVGEGSTFWAHFPRVPPEADAEDGRSSDAPYAELLERVVTIRRS